MNFGKNNDEEKEIRHHKYPKRQEPKDPYRWVTFVVLVLFIFVAYLFWAEK